MNRSNLFSYEQNQVDLKKITNKADDMQIQSRAAVVIASWKETDQISFLLP